MSDPVDIEWRSKGVKALLRDVAQVSAALNGVPNTVAVNFRGTGAGLSAKGTGGQSPAQQMRAAAQAQIFAARVQAAQARQQTVAQLGTIRVQRAQLQLTKAQAQTQGVNTQAQRVLPPFAKRLETFIRSTRFGGGEHGGVMPLVGRGLDLFKGMAGGAELAEALTGPVGLVVAGLTAVATVAVKGAEAINNMAQQAAEASRSFQGMRFSTGATTGEAARLAALGSAAGLSPDAIAGMSAGLQDKISGDPFGRATGMKLGLFNTDRRFGQTDEGGQLLQAIERLRAENPQSRVRDARILGLEGASPLFNLSNRQFGLAKQDAGTQAQVFNPKFAEQSADFMASLGRVSEAMQNLMASLSPAFMPVLTQFFNELATGINMIVNYVTTHQAMLLKVSDFLTAAYLAYTGDMAGSGQHMQNIFSGKDDRLANELSKNTDAVNANTGAIGVGQPGTYGVMNRQGALGDGMGGEAGRRARDADGFQLGAFSY